MLLLFAVTDSCFFYPLVTHLGHNNPARALRYSLVREVDFFISTWTIKYNFFLRLFLFLLTLINKKQQLYSIFRDYKGEKYYHCCSLKART